MDILGQRLDSSGDRLWDTTGVPVVVLDGNQIQNGLLAVAADEFIAVWDGSMEPFVGIFANRVGSGGSDTITDCTPPPTATPPQRNSLRPLQANPNPFNPRTTISFELGEAGPVRLEVYDLRGRVVARLLDDWMADGPQDVVWDGRSDRGDQLPSGVYFLRLEQHGQVQTRKVALVQ